MRSELDHGLAAIEGELLGRMEGCEALVGSAVDCLLTGDHPAAEALSRRARELAQSERATDAQLLALIARQSPVAGDLRVAIALLHLNERTGRIVAQCATIAALAGSSPSSLRPSTAQSVCVGEMADLVVEQIRQAVGAFAARDPQLARGIEQRDAAINELNRACFALGVSEGRAPDEREVALFCALAARAIERVGDNAVGIARQVEHAAPRGRALTAAA